MSDPTPKPLPFEVPTNANPEFAALPGPVRRDVRGWANRLARIWHVRPITGALQQLARERRAGYSTILRKYYRLRDSGDWRTLISRRCVPIAPLTVRVPLPRCGLRVKIIAHGEHEALIQIERIDREGSSSK